MKTILATHNAAKVSELQAICASFAIELIPQSFYNIAAIPETGSTFVENALQKARHATQQSGLPAIADDSGLVVPALNGAPGIFSKRYAGEQASDQENNTKLLKEMQHLINEQRTAFYYCALVYLSHEKDPVPLICVAQWSGIILENLRGIHGFGYDPLFYVTEKKQSAAELTPSQKNSLSHRARATQLLFQQLSEKLKYDRLIRTPT